MWGRKLPGPRKKIPASVQAAVRARDGNACRKCGSKTDLQFDHRKPVSRGGKNTVGNLQILCGTHNREKGASKRYKVNPPPKKPKVKTTRASKGRSSGAKGLFGSLFTR